MPDLSPLIRAADVPAGKAVRVRAPNGRWVVVCNDRGTFYAADCVCPHAGGPLGGAEVRDGCVVCPVHYWPWNLRTGLADESLPDLRLAVYPCEVREGTVYASISSDRPSSPFDLDCHT